MYMYIDNEPIADEATKLGPLASLDSHAAVGIYRYLYT
jgi:hypothetical protein